MLNNKVIKETLIVTNSFIKLLVNMYKTYKETDSEHEHIQAVGHACKSKLLICLQRVSAAAENLVILFRN